MRVRRLLALSTVTGLLAAATPLTIPASTAFAAASDTALIYTVDTNGDQENGLAKAAADGTGRVILSESPSVHYDEVETAPVGEAIAYTKYVGNVIGLFLDNRELTAPRELYKARLVNGTFRVPYHPSFSPDGRTVLFTIFEYDNKNAISATHLERVPVRGGASTVITGSDGLFDASFHPTDATQITASRWAGDGALMLGHLAASTLTATPIPGTATTDAPHFSPDGSHIVFTHADKDVTITTLDGSVTSTVTGLSVAYPVWLDDATVLFTMLPPGGNASDIFRVDVGATTATQVTTTPDNEAALATPRAANPPPTAPTAVTAVLNGAQVTLAWTPPIDGDVTDFVVRRAPGTLAPATTTDGTAVSNAGRTGVIDAVTPGDTYSYSIFAVDAAQQISPAASITLQALSPTTITAPRLAWTHYVTPRVPVSWGAGAPAGTHFNLSYGVGSRPTSWHSWIPSTTSRSGYFGSRLTPGALYTLRVIVVDNYGNHTSAAGARVAVPRDDTAASFDRRWSRVHGDPYWLGAVTSTRIAGASVTLRFSGMKVQVLGTRCPTCGSFRAYVDGHYHGTYSSQGRYAERQVLYTYTTVTVRAQILTLVNVATPGHPQLRLDAFAVTN